jgi:TP901 family phage tail tape measure protein
MSLELDIDSGKADRSLANTLALVNSLGESLTKLGSMNKAGLRSVQQEIQNIGKQSSLDSIRRIASLMNLSLDDMIKSAKGKVPAKEIDRINKELNASFITMKTILSDAGNVVSAEAMKMVSKMDAPVDHAVKRVKAATSTMTDGVASATEASGRRAKTIAQKYSEDMTKAYEAMVFHDPKAKVTPRGEQALYQYMEAGAKLSAPHKKIAKAWAASHVDMARELQEQSKQEIDAEYKRYLQWFSDKNATVKSAMVRINADYAASLKVGTNTTKQLRKEAEQNVKNRAASATGVSEDDIRFTLGMPARSELERLKASIIGHWKDVHASARKARLETDKVWGEFSSYNAKRVKRTGSKDEIDSEYSKYLEWFSDKNDRVNAAIKALNAGYAASLRRGTAAVAQLRKEAEQTVKNRANSATPMSEDDIRFTFGMPSSKDMERLKASITGHWKDIHASARKAGLDTEKVWGQFSVYNAKMAKPIEQPTKKTGVFDAITALFKDSDGKFKKLGDDMGYAHSAARGLASGFNLLWLTWGAMAPIFAGAAVSNSLRMMVQQGAAVEHEMTKIRVLSRETSEDVGQLTKKMLDLGYSSQYGPLELATAMKTLSLAGLNAGQVYEAINTVLNFATAGDTTVAKASEVLTGVAQAFKYNASEYGYVADIISVAAATSKSSVETMGEAFKTASVAYTQYGVSLKESATVLAALSNVNIQGTAAGTAFRNMLADLTGRTPKAVAALKKLGVEMTDIIDASGKMRPLDGIMLKVLGGLDKFKGPEKFDILRNIFTERGEKGAIEMIQRIKTETEQANEELARKFANDKETMGKVPVQALMTYADTYKKIQAELNNSAGFSIIAAAEMSLTTQNQLLAISSAFRTAMVSAFAEIQPYVVDFSVRLREILRSQDFRDSVAGLANVVMSLVDVTMRWGKALSLVVLGYMTLKGLTLFGGAAIASTLAFHKAIVGVNGAMAVAVGLSRAFIATPWGAILTGLALAIGAAAAAWNIFTFSAEKAKNKSAELATQSNKALIDKLDEEIGRLEKMAEARRKNITLQQLELQQEIAVKEMNNRTAGQQLQAEIDKQKKIVADNSPPEPGAYRAKRVTDPSFREDRVYGPSTEAARKAAQQKLRELESEQAALGASMLILESRKTYAAKLAAAQEKAERESLASTGPKLPKTDFRSLANSQKDYTNFLQETNDQLSKMSSVLDRQHTNRMLILKAQHDAGLKSAADFADEEFAEIRRHEAAKSALMSQVHTEQVNKFAQEDDRLRKEFGEKNIQAWLKLTDDQIAKTDDSKVKSHMLEVRAFMHAKKMNEQKRVAETETLTAEINNRMIKSSADYLVEQSKGVKTIGDDVKKLEDAISALTESEAAMGQLAGKKPEEIAAMKARAEAIKQWADNISAAVRVVEELNAERAKWEKRMDAGDFSPEVIDNYANATTLRNKASESLDRLRNNASRFAADKSAGAFKASLDEEYKKFADEFKGTLSDAVSTAIFQGGAEGGKKLRNYLQQVLIERPFKIMLESAIDTAFGKSSLQGLFNWSTGRSGVSSPSIPTIDSFNSWEFDLASLLGKASGGTINPYSGYRVNESGMEMLSVGGKDYLMTGGQGGNITPANRLGATVVFSPQIHVDSRADQAQVMALVQRAVAAGNAKLVDQLQQAGAI